MRVILFCGYLKGIVLSIILNIMVESGSLLSCAVVVLIRKLSRVEGGGRITLARVQQG